MSNTACVLLLFKPIGVPGELHLAGPKLARGYIGRPDLTARSFRHHSSLHQRLYATGDRARWLPSGDLEFLGRIDFQIKLNGQRIEPGEIQAAARSAAGVREAVVGLRPTAAGTDRLVAWVVPGRADPGAVLEACRAGLPGYMAPSVVVPLAEWPLSSSGKLDRRALPMPELKQRPEQLHIRAAAGSGARCRHGAGGIASCVRPIAHRQHPAHDDAPE